MLRAVAFGSRLLPTRPVKDFHLQSSAHAGHTNDARLVIDSDGLGSNTDEVTITLTDIGHGGISIDGFVDGELVLSITNQDPQVGTTLLNQSSDEDTAVSFTLPSDAFTDADGDTLTLTATLADGSALPSWLTFTASTRTFSGTPPQDYNGTLSIKVAASDGQTGSTPATQTFSLTISPVNDDPAGYVTIDGTVAEGQTLSANTTMLADPDGLGTLAYRWQASTDGVQWTDIAGASSASYTPSAAQAGQMLRVVVSYTDDGGTSESVTSALAGLSTAQIAALAEILEDSASPGGSGNANGVAVTNNQLALVVDRILGGSDTMEARYKAAIQAETGFSNLPTTAEVQAIIDAENEDLSGLFAGDSRNPSDFNGAYVVDWDVSSVTNMAEMFINSEFNQNIGGWDVSSVTNMAYMFAVNYGTQHGVFNQDIGDWNVSSVTNMAGMFSAYPVWEYAHADFNQDIGDWDVSSVTTMREMFMGAKDFNQNIGDWDVSSVTDTSSMFYDAEAFNQDIGDWDISSLQRAYNMLDYSGISTANFDNLLAGWSTDSSGVDGDGIDDIPLNLTLGAVGLTYTDQAAFDRLVNVYGWTIEGATFDTEAVAVLAEVLEDSASSGGSSNANGVAVTDDQLALVAERVLAGSETSASPMEARYQAAIQAETGFSNLPTTAEVQAIIDAENADLSGLFAGVDYYNRSDFNEGYIGNWDVSSVTDMSRMFHWATSFNQAIGDWDVSSVSDMQAMFSRANDFNQAIGEWDVSSVTDMSSMFLAAYVFNQAIGEWDVSSVSDMSLMFYEARDFNQAIGEWDVSAATDMSGMFRGARSFDQAIGDWDVNSVTDMSLMFLAARDFNQNIGEWDVSSVTDMSFMFYIADAFDQDIGDWDVSSVTDMSLMFSEARNFNQAIGDWDVSSVTEMSDMFGYARAFNQAIGNWDVSAVTDMSSMFAGAINFNQDIGDWDVSSVTDMSYMFSSGSYGDSTVFNQDIGEWDVSSVTDMSGMFGADEWGDGDTSFNQAIGDWDVSSVTNMSYMFKYARVFNQNIGDWDISSLVDASYMLDYSGISTANFDYLLAGWSTDSSGVEGDGIDDIPTGVTLGAVGLTYTDQVAFDRLVNDYGWTIDLV